MGIVGAGTWGETHAYLYNEHSGVELVAIIDLDKSKAANFARKFNIENVFFDHNEMLRNVDLDAVAIVTPNFVHVKIVEDYANSGKHMIVENH
jgi:predicted dehydrogenase